MRSIIHGTLQSNRSMTNGAHQYLLFFLGNEMYAVSNLAVQGIVGFDQVTMLRTRLGELVLGVIARPGVPVPVIDVASQSIHGGATRRTRVIIVSVAQADDWIDVGLLVDAVVELQTIMPDHIAALPPFAYRVSAECLSGTGRVEGGFVMILDVNKMLRPADHLVLYEVTQGERLLPSVMAAAGMPA